MDPYELIELFGLTETANDLPIPDDETLAERSVREAFEALFAPLSGTGLAVEVEPLAHGFATLLHRRREAIDDAMTKQTDALRALIRANDGSEISDTEISATQTRAERLRDIRDALAIMAESAARCYEIETGRAYIPPSGGRTNAPAHLTGAIFEARQWLEDHERQQAAQFQMDGTPLALAGDRDWTDHRKVWETLDAIQTRFRESFATSLILYHKGDKWGADAIAAAWAKSRKVPQVIFAPNWRAFGKSAGFKAIDQMLDTPRPLGGVVIFGTSGVALNLATKAEARGIKAMRVRPAAPKGD
ncbi:MAG: DUF2493 domain-containing protein [Rhodobacteraceae bacterium]|nr:DUF2493 domain-containing protein [Paracoccaceae bacterium]MBD1204727.1 DUF2493 domain-containing protein [Paracoccaceae bacterium]